MGILIGILILSVMMIVHELGHYLTGRALGFTIEEFAIFMGPKIYSTERNGIRYSLRLLPIGASVSFAGEYEEEGKPSTDPGHFFNRPKWARAIVIATGPILNLLSGILAFLIMFSAYGYTIPVVAEVMPDTQASVSGLRAGDRILRADGDAIRTILDYGFVDAFQPATEPLDLTVRGADGTERQVTVTPTYRKTYRLGITVRPSPTEGGVLIETVDPKSNGGQPVLQAGDILLAAGGVPYTDRAAFNRAVSDSAGRPFTVRVLRSGQTLDLTMAATEGDSLLPRGILFQSSRAFLPAVEQSLQSSWSIVKLRVKSIGRLIAGEIKPSESLSGPVGVVTMISDVVATDISFADKIINLLMMFALVSISLGFMNLLPIPPLDGNHLVLIAVEAIRGRRLSPRTQGLIGAIGIAIIVLLAVTGLIFDIQRLIGR